MNTLVLLVAGCCAPAADPLPVMETTPYAVPRSITAATQDWPETPQQNRPRFLARLRGRFSRKSRAVDGRSPELSGYSQGIPGNSTISPAPSAFGGILMGDTNPPTFNPQPSSVPTSSPTMQRMPTPQPF
jgi:hypothetical protein